MPEIFLIKAFAPDPLRGEGSPPLLYHEFHELSLWLHFLMYTLGNTFYSQRREISDELNSQGELVLQFLFWESTKTV